MPIQFHRRTWKGPEYHITAEFRAPLPFAFGWCTDYDPVDPKLEKESYERRIVRRSRREVVLEDIEWTDHGWAWQRLSVTLQPPDRWHLDMTGNYSDIVADYRLTSPEPRRTRLDIWWRRRQRVPMGPPISKRERERASTLNWKRFARALNRDYHLQGTSRAT